MSQKINTNYSYRPASFNVLINQYIDCVRLITEDCFSWACLWHEGRRLITDSHGHVCGMKADAETDTYSTARKHFLRHRSIEGFFMKACCDILHRHLMKTLQTVERFHVNIFIAHLFRQYSTSLSHLTRLSTHVIM